MTPQALIIVVVCCAFLLVNVWGYRDPEKVERIRRRVTLTATPGWWSPGCARFCAIAGSVWCLVLILMAFNGAFD